MPRYLVSIEARIIVEADDETQAKAYAEGCVIDWEHAKVCGTDTVCCTEEPSDA